MRRLTAARCRGNTPALTGRFYFIPSPPAVGGDAAGCGRAAAPPVAALTPPNTAARTPSIITGAGAMFPYPIYALWSEAYKKETGVGLNYQSVGSRAGIRQILARTVAFAASDLPLQSADLERDGLLQFPAVMGGAVPIVNIEGVKAGDLALDGAILAKIFLGEIKSWNDPAIQRLNPMRGCPRSRSWRCIGPMRPRPPTCSPIISARSARTGGPRSAPDTTVRMARRYRRQRAMTGRQRRCPDQRRDRLRRIRVCQAQQARLSSGW